ncbi:MAG TPA: glyoxylate/hydroxypyruvate reductase A [Hyphomicrobiaceae bacterium]
MNGRIVLALFSRRHDLSFLKPLLERADPLLDVVVWPDARFREAEVAVGWEVPPGMYDEMPRLRLVHSIAAGVDNIIAGQDLHHAQVCRVVDPQQAEGMLQFVLWTVLLYHRRMDAVLANQSSCRWDRPPQLPAADCRVGLMGLGEMGNRIAAVLPMLGYTVNGWSRSARKREGVTVFRGEAGLAPFLASTDVLVCLLPLTDDTRGILCKRVFDALPRGAALVHCGRGEHLVEPDLVQALASGHLRGAVIDVFEDEPLPSGHPFWTLPGVIVTPHMATMADPNTVAAQIVHNVALLRRGERLCNTVDLKRGY